jgi:hypothetical protein
MELSDESTTASLDAGTLNARVLDVRFHFPRMYHLHGQQEVSTIPASLLSHRSSP